jgi:hypothetical protein
MQASHCEKIPLLETYPNKCANPYEALGNPASQDAGQPAVQGVGHPVAEGVGHPVAEGVGTPVHMDRANGDPTYGTEDNLDDCQVPLVDIHQVWTTECPGGGAPVPKYGQCGGMDWDGPKCCFGYAICVQVRF